MKSSISNHLIEKLHYSLKNCSLKYPPLKSVKFTNSFQNQYFNPNSKRPALYNITDIRKISVS